MRTSTNDQENIVELHYQLYAFAHILTLRDYISLINNRNNEVTIA